MSHLKTRKCDVCHVGAPQVTQREVLEFHPMIPEWRIIEEEGVKKLRRRFAFQNFSQGMTFVVKIGAIAEQEGHHPAVHLEYSHVIVWCWTHKIGGLHVNDFILAAKIDEAHQAV